MPDDYAACYCRKVYCRGCKGYHCQCGWSGVGCRTEFRKHLNKESSEYQHRNGRFKQLTRPYGDYLYYQDREKFEVEFAEWNRTYTRPPIIRSERKVK